MQSSVLKVGILSSIISAALVYVAIEWQPLGSGEASTPMTSSAAGPDVTYTPSPPMERIEAPEPAVPSIPPPPDANSGLSDEEQNNIDIYRRFSRSVVNVSSTTYTYDFFLRPIPSSGFGSGVVIDSRGHIVTNYHVVANATEVDVTLWDQSRYAATLVGVDPNNDLALIRVDAALDWTPLPMGTTQGLQVGQKVLAIGNPFGLERTLTTGIISSLGRSILAPVQGRERVIEGIIQTDAAINQGNSGGPLLNSDGELIGINSAIVSGATGIGFAIPVETVRRVTNDILAYGRVRRVSLEINGSAVNRDLDRLLDLGADYGVLVIDAIPGGSADRAGIRGANRQVQVRNYIIPVGGDVIQGIEGRTIRSMTDIAAALERYRPGDDVTVSLVRDGEPITLDVELQEEPQVR